MGVSTPLSPYFARQAVGRLNLEGALANHVEQLLGLLDATSHRARVSDIHDALFPYNTRASANASLNRLLHELNDAAEKADSPLRMVTTSTKSVGADKRFVWFEGSATAPPQPRTTELDSIPADRLVQSRATASQPTIVLITYNEHETAAVLAWARGADLIGERPPTESRNGRSFSKLGIHNGWLVIHLVSRQGESHSQQSTIKAIQSWTPVAVVGVGIAFGVDPDKQHLGDVLVSEAIVPYDLARASSGGTSTLRAIPFRGSPWLVQRLLTCDHAMKSHVGGWPAVQFGRVLSGSKLIDDVRYRDSLLALAGDGVIGGEMEGEGLALAAEDAKIDWLVVKGICGWADGNKNSASKDADQRLAADNAMRVVAEMLAEPPEVSVGGATTEDLPTQGPYGLAILKELSDAERAFLIRDTSGVKTSMKKESVPEVSDAQLSTDGVDVMEALLDWVDDPAAPPVFAILGGGR